MKNEKIKIKLDEIREIDNKISGLRDDKKNIIDYLTKKQKRYNNSIVALKDLNNTLSRMLKCINKRNYPKNSFCSHFGVSGSFDRWSIKVSSRRGKCQLVFNITNEYISGVYIGVSKKVFNAIKKNILENYNIIESWNGEENHCTMSLVLDYNLPKTFVNAVENNDDFAPNFSKIFHKNMEREQNGKR